jgi:hypothetical protein
LLREFKALNSAPSTAKKKKQKEKKERKMHFSGSQRER